MPTLHHTLDRGGSYIRARVYASSPGSMAAAGRPGRVAGPAEATAIASSREARFYLSSAGVDRLREHGCYDEGDYVPGELFRELVGRGEAREGRRTATIASGPPNAPAAPRLFPEPQPPCWMLPRRRMVLGL